VANTCFSAGERPSNSMYIDTCVENFSGAILWAVEASTPKRRPIGEPRPQIPAGIQDEIV